MVFLTALFAIFLLVILIGFVKLDVFISFILVCLCTALLGGLSMDETMQAIQSGLGSTLGSLVMILGFGAMLGKLLAESGAANRITDGLVEKFGKNNIQFALIVAGFIVGIPMFYLVGFVILVPLVIAIAIRTKLPLLYVGLPMLASLSVTHGFLPPHPAPTAVAQQFGADLGLTLMYGIIVGIPAILAARYLMSGVMQRIRPVIKISEMPEAASGHHEVSLMMALAVALLPVFLIAGSSAYKLLYGPHPVVDALGEPALAMLLAVLAALYFLGIRRGLPLKSLMKLLSDAVSDIAQVLFIIAGAGAFKEVLLATGLSEHLGQMLTGMGLSPLLLAWLVAAVIRVSVGSATVAALTAAGIVQPLIAQTGISAELLVLAIGAGSIFFSHINDGGFWLFKEYFNVSVKDTLRSWTMMESIVSLVGLLCILLLNSFMT